MEFPAIVLVQGIEVKASIKLSVSQDISVDCLELASTRDGVAIFQPFQLHPNIDKEMSDCYDIIYLIRSGDGDKYKLGHSTFLEETISEMQDANPEELEVIAVAPWGNGDLYYRLLDRYQSQRLRRDSTWLRLETWQVRNIVTELSRTRSSYVKPEPVECSEILPQIEEMLANIVHFN